MELWLHLNAGPCGGGQQKVTCVAAFHSFVFVVDFVTDVRYVGEGNMRSLEAELWT